MRFWSFFPCWNLGRRAWDSRFGVVGLGFKVRGLTQTVQGSGPEFRMGFVRGSVGSFAIYDSYLSGLEDGFRA